MFDQKSIKPTKALAGPGPKVQFPPVFADKVKEPDSAACETKSGESAMLQVWLAGESNASTRKQQVSHHTEGTPTRAQGDLLELGKKRLELLSWGRGTPSSA